MKYALAAIACLAAFWGCSSLKTTGTSDETLSGVAKIYKPDGTAPAINAVVRLYKVADTTRVPQYQTLTDDKGSFKLGVVPNGTYNLWVSQDSFVAYQDSIVVADRQTTIVNDTLELYGSIVGHIRLQSPDDPRRVIIHVPGTGFYANVDADNRFAIGGLATGSYTLSLVPLNLADYTPTFVSMTAHGGKTDTLDTIEVIYNGIPIVKMGDCDYDSSTAVVTLRWEKPAYNQLGDFIIHRYQTNATVPDLTPYAATTDTFFCDTLLIASCMRSTSSYDTSKVQFIDQQWTYRVSIRTLSLKEGLTYKAVNINAVDPLRVLKFFDRRYQPTYLHQAAKIHAAPSGWYGPSPTFEWSQGGGAFTKGGPDSSMASQKLLDPVVVRVSGVKGRTHTDTIWLVSGLIWEKTGPAFLTGDTTWSCTDSHSVWVGESNGRKLSLWKSQDCLTWQKLTDSLPFPVFTWNNAVASMAAYKSKLWIVDSIGRVQSSADGATWTQVGTQALNGLNTLVPLAVMRDTLFAITSTLSAYSSAGLDIKAWASVDGLSWKEMPKQTATTIRATKEPFAVNDTFWMIGYASYTANDVFCKTGDFRSYQTSKINSDYTFPGDYRWTQYLGTVIGLGETCFQIRSISNPLILLPVIAPAGMTYSECVEFKGRLYNFTKHGVYSVK